MSFHYPLILDGGFATELERTFNKDLTVGKLWSAKCLEDDPEAIKSVHKLYFEAGADIATTCSYQASIDGFIQEGFMEQRAIELMHKSIRLACEARDEFEDQSQQSLDSATEQSCERKSIKKLIALSIGCYGAILANGAEYTGNYGDTTVEDLVQFHKGRLSVFLKHDHSERKEVDMIIFETIPSFTELQAICRLVQEESELPPIAVSVQCRADTEIADGTALVDVLNLLNKADPVFAVGFNCTKPRYVENLFATFASFNKEHRNNKAIIAYPDGGEEWNEVTRAFDSKTKVPEECFGQLLAACVEKYGPRVIVGGCCGTGPRHIKEIVKKLK